jgi:hypothetical protein
MLDEGFQGSSKCGLDKGTVLDSNHVKDPSPWQGPQHIPPNSNPLNPHRQDSVHPLVPRRGWICSSSPRALRLLLWCEAYEDDSHTDGLELGGERYWFVLQDKAVVRPCPSFDIRELRIVKCACCYEYRSFCSVRWHRRSQDSAVRLVVMLLAGWSHVKFLAGGKGLVQIVITGSGTQSLIRSVQGVISPGIKRPGREANVPPVHPCLVKNGRSYASSPVYTFVVCTGTDLVARGSGWCRTRVRMFLGSQEFVPVDFRYLVR